LPEPPPPRAPDYDRYRHLTPEDIRRYWNDRMPTDHEQRIVEHICACHRCYIELRRNEPA